MQSDEAHGGSDGVDGSGAGGEGRGAREEPLAPPPEGPATLEIRSSEAKRARLESWGPPDSGAA